MRVADYLIKTLADHNVDTAFLVTGGMAMHLDDALACEPRIKSICCHHEQATTYAAEGYGHVLGRPALVSVTAGPGAINSLTGVFGAYVDSVPMIVLAGQAKRELTRSAYNFGLAMRQLGEQEVDSVAMASPVTKYANRVMDPSRVRFEIEKALFISTSGRPGPVWLEIPLDVQSSIIEPDALPPYKPCLPPPFDLGPLAKKIVDRFNEALRPLIVVGPGVCEGGSTADFELVAKRLGCPLVGAGPQDALTTDHPQYAGRIGALGTRAGNLAVQNADLIVFVGIRCYLSQITYNWPALGRHAHKIMVDEDPAEFEKPCQIADEAVPVSAKPFLSALAAAAEGFDPKPKASWLNDCRQRVKEFPPVSESMRTVLPNGRINPYWFIEELCARLTANDVLATSNASAGLLPIQAGSSTRGQRFFSNLGSGAMGFGLPAAIGAALAASGRRVICFEGDGSLMMNMQELQTLAHLKLPIILVVLENDGYVSIRQTQRGFFGRELGSGPQSGVTFPDFGKIAQAFGLPSLDVSGPDFRAQIDQALKSDGPLVMVAHLDPDQPFEPKVASRKLPDGTMVSSPPEDMSPFLPRETLRSNFMYPLEED
jgi:acetolactate synthase-1/2/3 large subunit